MAVESQQSVSVATRQFISDASSFSPSFQLWKSRTVPLMGESCFGGMPKYAPPPRCEHTQLVVRNDRPVLPKKFAKVFDFRFMNKNLLSAFHSNASPSPSNYRNKLQSYSIFINFGSWASHRLLHFCCFVIHLGDIEKIRISLCIASQIFRNLPV